MPRARARIVTLHNAHEQRQASWLSHTFIDDDSSASELPVMQMQALLLAA